MTYFHRSGKYYGDGNYMSKKSDLYRIFDEVKEMRNGKYLPGLKTGHSDFMVLIDVPSHPHRYPHLVV